MLSQPSYNFHPHSHTAWEAIYYTFGEGTMEVNGQNLIFSTGDLICIPPNTVHYEHSEKGFMNIHIHFKEFKNGSEIIKVRDTENHDIKKLLQFMHSEFHLNPKGRHRIPESLLEVLGYYVESRYPARNKSAEVEAFENLIVSNISNPEFDLKIALSNASKTPGYFRKIFKKQTGLTPLQYLTKKRIEYAKKLLETRSEKNMKVLDISTMAGFKDPYYFSRVFKKHEGVSPEAWKPSSESKYDYDFIKV